MPRTEAAVVGAGVVGCLTARQLAARHPGLSITVLDRDAVGAGASRRSAGLHVPRGSTARIRRMSAYSHQYYSSLKLSPSTPVYQVGATVIANRVGRESLGGGYLDQAAPAVVDRVPQRSVSIPDGSRAWRITGCHYADVHQLTQAVAAELRPRVRFLEGVAVTGLCTRRDAITIESSTGESLVADLVVLAPGPWIASRAWRDRIAPLGLRVKKIVALHIEQRPEPAAEAVIFDDEDAFLLPLAHRGHWLFSYTCPDWDVDPDVLTPALSSADIGRARETLRRYSPALAAACVAGRVFCDAYSQNREPVARALDETGRLVLAGAANGSGYRLAPAIGAEAADLLQLHLN